MKQIWQEDIQQNQKPEELNMYKDLVTVVILVIKLYGDHSHKRQVRKYWLLPESVSLQVQIVHDDQE